MRRVGLAVSTTVIVMIVALLVGFVGLPGLANAADSRLSAFDLRWSENKNTGDGLELTGDSLAMTPQGTSDRAAGTVATAEVVLGIKQGATIDAGKLEVRVPAYIFKNRDGAAVGSYSVGLGKDSGSFTWNLDDKGTADDKTDDEIVITNNVSISQSYNATIEIEYNSGDPQEIAGGVGDKGYNKKDITASIAYEDVAGKKASEKSSSLSVSYRTGVVAGISKSVDSKNSGLESWNKDWTDNLHIPEPENSDDYIYVVWQIGTPLSGINPVNSTQAISNITFSEQVSNGGSVVAWLNYTESSVEQIGGATYYTKDKSSTSHYVIVKYPKASLPAGQVTIDNTINLTVNGKDGDTATDSARASYQYTKQTFQYPPGNYDPIKYYEDYMFGADGNTGGQAKGSDINAIESTKDGEVSPVNLWFSIGSYNIGGNLTLGDGLDPNNPDSYGKKSWKTVETDDIVAIGNARLSPDDYELSAFNIRSYTLSSASSASLWLRSGQFDWEQASGGTWQWVEVDTAHYGDVSIEVQINGNSSWTKIGTISYELNGEPGGGTESQGIGGNALSTYTPEDGFESADMQGTVQLPQGVSAIRYSCETSAGLFLFGMSVDVRLKNTDTVRQLFKGLDSVTLTNVNSMEVYDAEGNWVNRSSQDSIKNEGLKDVIVRRDDDLFGGVGYPMHDSDSTQLDRTHLRMLIDKSTYSPSFSGDNEEETDPNNRRQVLHYRGVVAEYGLGPGYEVTAEDAFAWGLHEQKDGTVYDLLPPGMTIDPSSLRVGTISGDIYVFGRYVLDGASQWGNHLSDDSLVNATLEQVPNWKSTGRTMLIIHVSMPEGRTNYEFSDGYSGNTYFYSGFELTYDAYYPWEAQQDYGSGITNYLAYRSGDDSGLDTAYKDDPTLDTSSGYPDDIDKAMTDLNQDGNPSTEASNTVYTSASHQVNHIGSTETTTGKLVKSVTESNYSDETTVDGGGSYSYQLSLAGDPSMPSKNIVMYDKLEKYDDGGAAKRWYGTFDNLDFTQPKVKGISPVVYYSTDPDIDVVGQGSPDRDLTSPTWHQTTEEFAGVDKSTVTAIAVDLSKATGGDEYQLKGLDQSVKVIVNMTAPTDGVPALVQASAVALNDSAIVSKKLSTGGTWDDTFLPTKHTTVHLHADLVDFQFTKVEGAADDAPALPGATFRLYQWTGSGDDPGSIVDASKPGDGWTQVGSDVTSGDDGLVRFSGLSAGSYRLIEVDAPSGYAAPSGQWELTVDPKAQPTQVSITAVAGSDGTRPPAFKTSTSAGGSGSGGTNASALQLSLPNYKMQTLPVSGAGGTALLTVGGLVLVLGSVAWMLRGRLSAAFARVGLSRKK